MRNEYILQRAAYYYYGLLTPKNQKLYTLLLGDILAHKPKTSVRGMGYTVDNVNTVIGYILYDRPDIFWCVGNSCTLINGILDEVGYNYCYTKAQADDIISRMVRSNFYTQVKRLLTTKNSDFEKALALYEYIIKHCEYDNSALRSNGNDQYRYAYTPIGVMLYGRAVCSGYAKAFQYFANKFNVYCTYVSGETVRGSHGWNLVKLNGDYYYIDATWGDPTFTNRAVQDPNYVCYDYFCFTTDDMLKTHKAVLNVVMPRCTATRYNYHVYFGLCATTYSLQDVTNRVSRAVSNRSSEVTIRYTSRLEFNTALNRLISKQEIYTALRSAGVKFYGYDENSIRYSTNESNLTISINLKRI